MAANEEPQPYANASVGPDAPRPEAHDPAAPVRPGTALALAIGLAALAAVAGCKKDHKDPPHRIPKVYTPAPDSCGFEERTLEMTELVLSRTSQLTFELRPDVKVTAKDNRTEIDPDQIQIHDYLGRPLLILRTPEGIYLPMQGWDLPKKAIGKTVRFGFALQMRFLQSGSPTKTIGLEGFALASNGKRIRISEKDITYTKDPKTGKIHVQFKVGGDLWFKSLSDRETLENALETVSQPHFFVANYPPVLEPTSPRRRYYRPANSPTLMPHANREQEGFKHAEIPTIAQHEIADSDDTEYPDETPQPPEPETVRPSPPPAPPEPAALRPSPPPAAPPLPPEPESPETFEKMRITLAISFSPEGIPGQISITPPPEWNFDLKTGASATGAVEYLLILKNSQTGQAGTVDITSHMNRLLTSRDSRPLRLEIKVPATSR